MVPSKSVKKMYFGQVVMAERELEVVREAMAVLRRLYGVLVSLFIERLGTGNEA